MAEYHREPLMTAGILIGSASAGFLMDSITLFGAHGVSAMVIMICALLSAQLKTENTLGFAIGKNAGKVAGEQ
ncbi:hypothetical protein EIM92_16905 [Paenibacillus lentus]|uniref:Uncharacterized protein n=2 Tax=Paenibacillus lentus TaxID=1338368 RepID=A0A3Q8SCR0_9BACL|nr:hypothetical protein EIM92_16905 [Paenibacillus lentus]